MIDMKVIEAPNDTYSLREKKSVKVFLAGGISGCRDWQKEYIESIKSDFRFNSSDFNVTFTLYNPRRESFNIHEVAMREEQIVWEYNKLQEADIISFWFTNETTQPITLYELGKALGSGKKIIIGMDEDYERYEDVRIQAELAGYDTPIINDIDRLSAYMLYMVREEMEI